jgi:hypothetical protein
MLEGSDKYKKEIRKIARLVESKYQQNGVEKYEMFIFKTPCFNFLGIYKEKLTYEYVENLIWLNRRLIDKKYWF